MKFAAWRKVLSIFLLAVFLCAVPSLLTACSCLGQHGIARQHAALFYRTGSARSGL